MDLVGERLEALQTSERNDRALTRLPVQTKIEDRQMSVARCCELHLPERDCAHIREEVVSVLEPGRKVPRRSDALAYAMALR